MNEIVGTVIVHFDASGDTDYLVFGDGRIRLFIVDDRAMIERMAKAIYEDRNGAGCVPWSRRDAAHKAPYLSDACAAIVALREPSETMLAAGGMRTGEQFTAMIDAALEEK